MGVTRRKCKICGKEVIINYMTLSDLKDLYYQWAYTHECLGNKLPFECYERAMQEQKDEIDNHLKAIIVAAEVLGVE